MSTAQIETAIQTDTVRPPRLGRFNGWLKSRLHSQLGRIADGTLRFEDGCDSKTFGAKANDGLDATIFVNDVGFYRQLAFEGDLGAAASYIDGQWDADDLTDVFRVLARNMNAMSRMDSGIARAGQGMARFAHRLARNSIRGSRKNIEAHYDLSNDFFELFLDPTMMYSSALFEDEGVTLEAASLAKLERVCSVMQVGPNDHVLEIGTGWGGFSLHAAQRFGARVTTTTISQAQHQMAVERVRMAGLQNRVDLLTTDYRDLTGQYDKLVSIEMIEAVGHAYLGTFFQKCDELLRPGGRLFVQVITMPEQRYDRYLKSVDFIQKYIFPGGCCPSIGAMQDAVGRNTNLRLVQQDDFGHSYALTLREWRKRFWDRIDDVRALGFDERFIRMWDYYFCYCEAAFLERAVGLSQLVWQKA